MSELSSVMREIPLPITQHYHILNKNISSLGKRITVMIPISEEEEKLIDDIDKKTLTFVRGNKTFLVSMRNVYCYGEVNFNDENTIKSIDKFNFLDYLGSVGIHICSRYNYKTHSCISPKRYCLWSETWSPAELAKIAYGYLGKPKRILLFNQTLK